MSAHDIVYRFLDTQSIGRKSRYSYVSVLRDFDAFVLKRAPATGRLSIDTLRAWLQHESRRSPLASVVHRTCVITHYLDWRTAAGGGSSTARGASSGSAHSGRRRPHCWRPCSSASRGLSTNPCSSTGTVNRSVPLVCASSSRSTCGRRQRNYHRLRRSAYTRTSSATRRASSSSPPGSTSR